MLRATPGLQRARSNHALTPARSLNADEIAPAIARVEAFARRHGVPTGIQVSPEHTHAALSAVLDARGWGERWPVTVMARRPPFPIVGRESDRTGRFLDQLVLDDHASAAWLAAWAACEGRGDVDAHADTVFAALRGRAWFARLGDDAVAIAVPGENLLGLFCIAVHPDRRRAGLGTAIVAALCARADRAMPYLQVEVVNTGAIALYERLGFAEVYRYRHRVAPAAQSRSSAHLPHVCGSEPV